jgi:energy-coupling factor transporter transmembrane protein EcfT
MAIVLARPPARRWQLRLLVALLGSSALLIPFALGGDLARLGPLFLRSSTAILAAVGMSLTLSSAELSSALEGLRAPRALAQLVAQTTAQLGAISSEGQRLVLARKLRGSTGTSANLELLSTLLIRSSERAERRALATELRGAAARIPRAFGDGRSVTFVFICCLLGAGAHWVGR